MEPEPISIIQALEDLSYNRLVKFLRQHLIWAVLIGIMAFVALAVFAQDYLIVFFLSIPLAVLTLLILYITAHCRFVSVVRKKRPLCPSCKSLVWQVCCSHCKNPVPPLTLLLKSAFLAHCPYCDCKLSIKYKTLQGWCGSCSTSIPHPNRHFSLLTVVEIELGTDLPINVSKEWEVKENSGFMELHPSSNGTDIIRSGQYPICYCVTHDPDSFNSIPDKIYQYVRKIWIGRDVNPLVLDEILDLVPIIKRRKTELFFEGDMVSNQESFKIRGFRKIHINMARLSELFAGSSSPVSMTQKKKHDKGVNKAL